MAEIIETPNPQTEVKPELWIPGMPLDVPGETPTPDEFTRHFAEKVWPGLPQDNFINLDESLAALAKPEKEPTGYAFIDIDDCVVELGTSLRRLQYADNDTTPRISHHDYGEGMFFDDSDTAIKFPLIRLIKTSGIGCVPTEGIDKIRDMMRSWRQVGIYVTFITSAIDGTELPAIDCVGKYFQGSCDGIVVTSGHYQLADKGKAATEVIDMFGATEDMPAAHIDDLIFNTTKVRRALSAYPKKLTVQTFQPVIPSHFELDAGSHHEQGALATFGAATEFFENQLGRRIHIPFDAILQRDRP